MCSFNHWIKKSEKEIKPLMNREISKNKGLVPERIEDFYLQHYFNFKLVRTTWILAIATVLIGLLSAIINLLVFILR